MKDILIIVNSLTSGGAEKQSVLLAKALTEDFNVHYAIFSGNNIHQKYLDLLKENPKVMIQIYTGGFQKKMSSLVSYIQKHKIKAIASYLTRANMFACIAGSKTHAKVFTGLRNSELPILKLWSDKLFCNWWSTLAISNSFSGKKNFAAKGFKDDKIVVIPNCFENIAPYTPKASCDGKVHIITVGRFVAQKDYETAIKAISIAAKECKNLVFDLIGYGELESQIRAWVKEYGIEDRTTIYLNPNNIPELLSKADIYISSSTFEGTSNSIMEAMNADLPIVATDAGDNACLVHHGENGFITPLRDVDGLAKHIMSLANDETMRIRMGEMSKKYLMNGYSVEKFREQYVELFNKYI